ncbi:MAG: [FeFe] hydrogenase, group A [Dorea sp.]|nr:[FeFe] hydrogenase, group A [Dorea sp.]
MVNLIINKKQISVPEGTTILEAAKLAGIRIPTLCYLKEINEIGACRICCVEVEGKDQLVASCNTKVVEGMVVNTRSAKALDARRTNLQAILAQHDFRCASCVRQQNCTLRTICEEMNITNVPFEQDYEKNNWVEDFPLQRDASKCIKCMRCVQICDKVQGINIWDMKKNGKRTTIGVTGGISIDQSKCVLCGQCITHCPTGALHELDETRKLQRAIADPEKIVVVQVAPAVRSAWADDLGIAPELATEKRMAAAIKELGADYVFDTNFSADLTIMEEGTELLERLAKAEEYSWPMFTSCCPGWVRYVKSQYPEFTGNLSTAKSPQQMFGAVAKTYFADKVLDVDRNKIYSVSIMPCTSKKGEIKIPNINDAEAGKDVDLVLTTRELGRLLRAEYIDVASLDEAEFDSPLGEGSGAGVIFGATGGVMEAALRTVYAVLEGKNPEADAFQVVRGLDGIKEATVTIAGKEIKAAVVSGLANTRKLLEKIKKGEVDYDFVEVMACPGGCAGGGGQPIVDGVELAGPRGQKLYALDAANVLRFSHENKSVQAAYENYFEKPNSHLAHELLHTDHFGWEMPR